MTTRWFLEGSREMDARAPRRWTLLLVLVAVVMTACSSGSGSDRAGSGASAGSPQASAALSAAGDPAVTVSGQGSCNPEAGAVASAPGAYASVIAGALCGMRDIDPCAMLSSADVQALFSVPLAPPTTDHLGHCDWHLADPSIGDGLNVDVTVGQDPTSVLNIDLATATPLPGVGDRAGWETAGYFPHVGAIKGNETCEMSIAGGNAQLSVPSTGKGVFAKIDPAVLPAFMQQFGALCNQVFAGLGA